MANVFTRALLLSLLITISNLVVAQEAMFEAVSKNPRDTTIQFPLDYKIARPRLMFPSWDRDFDVYYGYHTPAIKKTQAAMTFRQDSVEIILTPNSIIPHAQLDSTTIVEDPKRLIGTWRMLRFRSIRFNDSVWLPTKTYYRLEDSLIEDKSKDEAFAVITADHVKLFARESGKSSFKKMMSARYTMENRRYLLMYKLAKAAGAVSQVGLDENGYLILNYPKVIERIKKGSYFSYFAVIEQYIFEKVQ